MQINLNSNERLVKEGPANLQRGWETVGGSLKLTDQRLVFDSHGFNVQTGATEIPISSITGTRPVWTKFLGFLPLFPNSLAVTAGDKQYNFVVSNRRDWAAAISRQISRAGA